MNPAYPAGTADPSAQVALQSASQFAPPVAVSVSERPAVDLDESRKREILREAREFFTTVTSYESAYRRRMSEELDFLALDHWPEELKRERNGRPCLSFDRIGPSVDAVVNDAAQSPPEPPFSPVGNGADKETAEILQGLLRNVENESQAEMAYMTAYRHAVSVGRGWWRLLSEYESDLIVDFDNLSADLLKQRLKVGAISNPFSVYPDPASQHPCYADMKRCIITEDLDKDAYDAEYPKSHAAGLSTFESLDDNIRNDWFPNKAVRVAEYWCIEESYFEVAEIEGGRVVPISQVFDARIRSTRKIPIRKVKCYKINGVEVLSEWEWRGRFIPIIGVTGAQILRKGKVELRGMVRAAMDANLSYDFMRSKQIEAIALAPLAPWRAAEGSIEGHEQTYADANRKPVSVLYYKPLVNGQPVAPPDRVTAEPNIQAITVAVQQADNDIKATLSTYDASLGNAGPESSGRAILARQREADNAHFHFHRNLGWAMQQTGRMFLDLVPHYYAAPDLITIMDPDGKIRQVQVNAKTLSDGVERVFALGDRLARYDVTISSGPSYASRRDQGVQAMLELTRTMPQAMMRGLDLLVRGMDFPGAIQLADRLRPPDIQAEQDDGAPAIPPQFQMRLAQAESQNQQLLQMLKQATDETERVRLTLASAERRTAMQEGTKATLGLAKLSSDEAREQLRAEIAHLGNLIATLNQSPETANPEPPAAAPPPGNAAEEAQPPLAPVSADPPPRVTTPQP